MLFCLQPQGFSCVDLQNAGMRQSGVYYLQIRGTTYWFLKVFCEQEIAEGGWTVSATRQLEWHPRQSSRGTRRLTARLRIYVSRVIYAQCMCSLSCNTGAHKLDANGRSTAATELIRTLQFISATTTKKFVYDGPTERQPECKREANALA